MSKIAVIYMRDDRLKGLEGEAGERFCRQLLKEGGDDLLFLKTTVEEGITLKKLKELKDVSLFIILKGIVYIFYKSVKAFEGIVKKRRDISFFAPLCNQTEIAKQRYIPPYLYQTLSVFEWVVDDLYAEFGETLIEAEEIDDFCFFFRGEILNSLPDDILLVNLHTFIKERDLKFGITKGIYVHRYGDIYESAREDLLSFIPLNASHILDIGCAKGLLGELLKKRQKCFVTGIDINPENISIASKRIDRTICGDIEIIVKKNILDSYDCIVCGDILEHLKNPWALVKGLKGHLKEGGLFIASVPNINNWAIIYEMLNGRWDYVPFSILSGEHLRFFTKETLRDMFLMEGYQIKDIILKSLPSPPKKTAFIRALSSLSPSIDERELEASEILIIASL